jgi:nicotinic acid mononucleotide adenylyltransferase
MVNSRLKPPIALMSKVNAALASDAGRASERLTFLVLPGAFSPVHSQHLRVMEVARHIMTSLGWYVIGGFLAPSNDDYVRRKIGDDTWPFTKRLELCLLATEDSPWVAVAPFAEFSSYRVTMQLQQSIQSLHRRELRGRPLVGVEVMGSDTAVRILGKILQQWQNSGAANRRTWYHPERLVLCLIRPGSISSAEVERARTIIQPGVAAIGIKLIVCSGEGAPPLYEVSSREIRHSIALQRWDQLRGSGWIAPRVLEKLQRGALAQARPSQNMEGKSGPSET